MVVCGVMHHRELLGRRADLPIGHISPHGAHLALDDDPDGPMILLLGAEIPEGAVLGDVLDVFVYLDSQDRPIATLATPALQLDEVAFLPVMDVNDTGAFVDWGLPKELLVPFAEQTRELRVGELIPVGLQIDRTDRLAGTMRVSDMLSHPDPPEEAADAAEGAPKDAVEGSPSMPFARGAWVEGVAWRNDPEIGLFVIVERRYVALLPKHEPQSLRRGEPASFRIARVLPDGKLELSLRPIAKEAVVPDAEAILAVLRAPNPPQVGNYSSPEQLLVLFGVSKKAFKRAVGRLLKKRLVRFDDDGFLVARDSSQPVASPPRDRPARPKKRRRAKPSGQSAK